MPSGKFRRTASDGHKWCTLCNVEKPYDQFGKNKNSTDGRSPHCRPCRSDYNKRPDQLAKRTAANRGYKLNDEQKQRKALRDSSPEKRAYAIKYARERYRNDPTYRLRVHVANGVRKALKGAPKKSRTFEMLGYTPQELRDHLESQFLPGMSWENYGTAWHIDHIAPISKFGPDEVDLVWQLSNLWPLWAHLNLAKSNNCDYVLPDDWQEIPEYAK